MIWKLYQALIAEKDARLADGRAYAAALLEQSGKTNGAVQTMSQTADKLLDMYKGRRP